MKLLLTLVATLLTATALTSSKPQAVPRATSYNTLSVNKQTHHPAAKFIR